jgi:hypothetical protein
LAVPAGGGRGGTSVLSAPSFHANHRLEFEFVARRAEGSVALPTPEGSGVHCARFASENSLPVEGRGRFVRCRD